MSRCYFYILVLFAAVTQALFGGFGGGVGICFGGGHDHEAESAVAGYLLACEHNPSFPAPVALDDLDHDSGCSCTDVEIELMDLLVVFRGGHEESCGVDLPVHAPAWNVDGPGLPVFRSFIQRAGTDDLACSRLLEVVRSTRLIL